VFSPEFVGQMGNPIARPSWRRSEWEGGHIPSAYSKAAHVLSVNACSVGEISENTDLAICRLFFRRSHRHDVRHVHERGGRDAWVARGTARSTRTTTRVDARANAHHVADATSINNEKIESIKKYFRLAASNRPATTIYGDQHLKNLNLNRYKFLLTRSFAWPIDDTHSRHVTGYRHETWID
jgi:hypothetical protein